MDRRERDSRERIRLRKLCNSFDSRGLGEASCDAGKLLRTVKNREQRPVASVRKSPHGVFLAMTAMWPFDDGSSTSQSSISKPLDSSISRATLGANPL